MIKKIWNWIKKKTPRTPWFIFVTVLMLQLFDVFATHHFIANYGNEGNPIAKIAIDQFGFGIAAIAKVTFVAIVSTFFTLSKRGNVLRIFLAISLIPLLAHMIWLIQL